MGYKDKDKQKEANKVAAKKYRDSMTDKGMTVAPKSDILVIPKRGKDIKVFEDLPPDVQASIDITSNSPEEKQKRTAAAIKYQHIFPDRYYCCGLCAGRAR